MSHIHNHSTVRFQIKDLFPLLTPYRLFKGKLFFRIKHRGITSRFHFAIPFIQPVPRRQLAAHPFLRVMAT